MRVNNTFVMSWVITLVLMLTGCTKALYKNWDTAGEEESLKNGYVSLEYSVESLKYNPESKSINICINLDELKSYIQHVLRTSKVSNINVSNNYSDLVEPPPKDVKGIWGSEKASEYATLNLPLTNTYPDLQVHNSLYFGDSGSMSLINNCNKLPGENLPHIQKDSIDSHNSNGPFAVYDGELFEGIYFTINKQKYVIKPTIFYSYNIQEVEGTQKYVLRSLIVLGTPLAVATDAVFTVVSVGCIFTLGALSGGLLFPMCMSAWPF